MSLAALIGLGRDIGSRLAVVGLIPGGALALFILALVWSGAPSDPPAVDRVLDHARDLDAWAGGLLFFTLVVLTLVLQPLQLSLVRLLEGYWPAPLRRLAEAGRARQLRRYRALTAVIAPRRERPTASDIAVMAEAYGELKRLFPADPDWVLPTRLGNVMRAAETRPGDPYGLDVVVAWPRLYPLLPDGVRALVDDERDGLDLAARFCAVFVVAAVVSLAFLAIHGWWLLVPAACLVLAWLSYRGAIAAALAYGEGIRAAVDLHRFDLLTAMHLPLPATLKEERVANGQLSLFLRQGQDVDFAYEHGAREAERA